MSYDSSYGNQDGGYGADQGQGGFQDPNAQGGFQDPNAQGGGYGDQSQGGFQDPNAQGGGFGGDQGGYQDPNAQGGGFGGDQSVDPNAGYGGDSSNVQTSDPEKKHHYVKDGVEAAAVGGLGYEAYKHFDKDDSNQQAQPEKKSWF